MGKVKRKTSKQESGSTTVLVVQTGFIWFCTEGAVNLKQESVVQPLCSFPTETAVKNKAGSLMLLHMVLLVNSGIYFHIVFNQRAGTTNCNPWFFPAKAKQASQLGKLSAGAAALPSAGSRDSKLSWAVTGVRRHIGRAANPWTTVTEKTNHKRFSLRENPKGPGSSAHHSLAPSLLPLRPPWIQQWYPVFWAIVLQLWALLAREWNADVDNLA